MSKGAVVEKKSGRPRSHDADVAILESTLELITKDGIAGVSIEGVAAAAGVGKTTIYRRWDDKESLICDALAGVKGALPELDGATLREDLRKVAQSVADGHASVRERQLHACFMGEMRRHPRLYELYRSRFIAPRRDALIARFNRAIHAGELRKDLDPEVTVELFMGPLLHWSVCNPDKTFTSEFIDQLLTGVLDGLRPR